MARAKAEANIYQEILEVLEGRLKPYQKGESYGSYVMRICRAATKTTPEELADLSPEAQLWLQEAVRMVNDEQEDQVEMLIGFPVMRPDEDDDEEDEPAPVKAKGKAAKIAKAKLVEDEDEDAGDDEDTADDDDDDEPAPVKAKGKALKGKSVALPEIEYGDEDEDDDEPTPVKSKTKAKVVEEEDDDLDDGDDEDEPAPAKAKKGKVTGPIPMSAKVKGKAKATIVEDDEDEDSPPAKKTRAKRGTATPKKTTRPWESSAVRVFRDIVLSNMGKSYDRLLRIARKQGVQAEDTHMLRIYTNTMDVVKAMERLELFSREG